MPCCVYVAALITHCLELWKMGRKTVRWTLMTCGAISLYSLLIWQVSAN